MPNEKNLSSLVLNNLESIEVFKYLKEQGLIRENEFYFTPDPSLNELIFDEVPTKNSSHLVSSGAIEKYIENTLIDFFKEKVNGWGAEHNINQKAHEDSFNYFMSFGAKPYWVDYEDGKYNDIQEAVQEGRLCSVIKDNKVFYYTSTLLDTSYFYNITLDENNAILELSIISCNNNQWAESSSLSIKHASSHSKDGADPINPNDIGAVTLEEVIVELEGVAWVSNESYGGHSIEINTIEVSEEKDRIEISLIQSDDAAAAKLQRDSYSNITRVLVSDNSLLFLCAEGLPLVDLTIKVAKWRG